MCSGLGAALLAIVLSACSSSGAAPAHSGTPAASPSDSGAATGRTAEPTAPTTSPQAVDACTEIGVSLEEARRLSGLELSSMSAKGSACTYLGALDAFGHGDTLTIQKGIPATSMESYFASMSATFNSVTVPTTCVWDDGSHTRFHCDTDMAPSDSPLYLATVVVKAGTHAWESQVDARSASARDTARASVEAWLAEQH